MDCNSIGSNHDISCRFTLGRSGKTPHSRLLSFDLLTSVLLYKYIQSDCRTFWPQFFEGWVTLSTGQITIQRILWFVSSTPITG